jgi:hypothetical protein
LMARRQSIPLGGRKRLKRAGKPAKYHGDVIS